MQPLIIYPKIKLLWIALLLLLVGLACAVPGFGPQSAGSALPTPAAAISRPAAGERFDVGAEVQIQSSAVAPAGIVRLELLVDGQVLWVDANANPQPGVPFIVVQPWTPVTPGTHVLQTKAYDADNTAGQSAPVVVEVIPPAAQAVEPMPSPGVTVAPFTPTPAALANVPTSTGVPPATATAFPLTPTPSPTFPPPTPTPTPGSFAATGLEPEGRFKEIWQQLGSAQSRLGYPTGPEIANRDYARQYFERGLMLWWSNPTGPDTIWALQADTADLRSGSTWQRFPDEWPGDNDYSCAAAEANRGYGPVRGFGYVWCGQPILQARLGNPRNIEAGSGGQPPYSRVQFFQGGVMLHNPLNAEIYVLFDQGAWQKFGE